MSYTFTSDWHSMWTENWMKDLEGLIGKEIDVLEIGSYEGRSAIWTIENILTHHNSKIVCLDIFNQPYFENFKKNTRNYFQQSKLQYIQGKSSESLEFLKSNDYYLQIPRSFDFIYVDGSHHPDDVIQDLVMSFDLLKPNGIMIMDDYGIVDPLPSPKEAIDLFLSKYEDQIEVLRKEYQVTIRRK